MKKILFLFVFVAGAMTLSAQCTKSASASGKACCAAKASATASASDVDKALASNPDVQKRVCEQSGAVTYYEKSVNSQSGSVTWNEVAYDGTTKKFTRVASAGMEKDAKGTVKTTTTSCQKGATKACCAAKKEGTK